MGRLFPSASKASVPLVFAPSTSSSRSNEGHRPPPAPPRGDPCPRLPVLALPKKKGAVRHALLEDYTK